tara:strand:- start:6 stop:857 length:852 start_codon:yes stop_codon:yes gene_type:complete
LKPEEITFQILEGVSPLNVSGETFFFKHPTIKQKLSDIKIQKDCEATGKKIGIKNEKELIDEAIDSGSWSKENEEKINDLRWLIEKTQSSIDKLSDPNLIKHNQQTVDGYKKDLEELNSKRARFTLASLENYCLSRSHSIFCERDCYVIKNGETEPLRENESKKVMVAYMNTYTSLLNRDNLIKAAYNPLFFDLVYMSESPIEIFPDPINSMTVFQKDLLFYAHILSSKLKNLEIPDSIRSNPVELFNFKPKKDGEKEKQEFNPRKFVESKGGLEKMKPEDKL